ncbi:MAG: dTDP-4-amino-4,6-dideoxygalactose transaminase [Candidatus Aminicenantes bacterium]|nr:dTDP-4-amino-4,6-dideoxygalactose transaminase [Candidatus Aminicenantes bacterium]
MIPFNKPVIIGKEPEYLNRVLKKNRFSGNGEFSRKCCDILEKRIGCVKAVMTPSCTAALEMAGLLCKIEPGDEVIMPSFTYVSTAGAFALRGAEIVWCDIREDTKNIDETKIEPLITNRTKVVVAVHYAGVACQMDAIRDICRRHNLFLVEDAAQAVDCSFDGMPLGKFGDLAALSFHETKNIQCGEGGALLVNNPNMVERAQFLRDKGTNRIYFDRGTVEQYTWIELGSSFLMSELQAAFLYPQLLESGNINQNRLETWNSYYRLFEDQLPPQKLPVIPARTAGNGHLFYVMADTRQQRQRMITFLENHGIMAIFHYVPLHKAPYWKGKYDNIYLPVTDRVSETLLRLPLYYNMTGKDVAYVAQHIIRFFKEGL